MYVTNGKQTVCRAFMSDGIQETVGADGCDKCGGNQVRPRFAELHRLQVSEMSRLCRKNKSGIRNYLRDTWQRGAHAAVIMGQDGHARMASAATSRNSFSVVPVAA
jgi:hypothetical protein